LGHSCHPMGSLHRYNIHNNSSSWLKLEFFLFSKGEELRELCHQYPPPRPIFASGANGSWVRGVAYARNGGQTATISDDGLIRFWNLLEPEVDPSAIAQGDEEMVCCTFSPSGRVFAVG
jgi:WD40 repeat protein